MLDDNNLRMKQKNIPSTFPLSLFIGSYLVQQLAVLYPNANNSFVKQLF